jgi:hypothetical protein
MPTASKQRTLKREAKRVKAIGREPTPAAARPPGEVDEHGIRAAYGHGCRCLPCAQANSAYQRHYRAAKLTGVHVRVSRHEDRVPGDVVAFPNRAHLKSPMSKRVGQVSLSTQPDSDRVGSVEQALLDETAPLPKAAERPATVAGACAMARILDDDALVAMHPQAVRQLQVILNELHSVTKRKSKGRLAAVQQMTKVKRR